MRRAPADSSRQGEHVEHEEHPEHVEHIKNGKQAEQDARTICLQLLTRRAHTRAELAAALARRHVPADIAERVLERLEDAGLVDDVAVATAFVATRHRDRGLARRALQSQLRRRGVSDEAASSALEALTEDDEVVRARALVARRLPAIRGQPADVRARRLAGMLARRGYGAGLASAVIREVLAADSVDAGDSVDAVEASWEVEPG